MRQGMFDFSYCARNLICRRKSFPLPSMRKKRTFFLVKQKFNYLKVFRASGCLSVAYKFFACGKSTQKYKQIYYKIKSNLSSTPKRNAKLRRTFKWLEILQFLLNKRMLLSHKKILPRLEMGLLCWHYARCYAIVLEIKPA